MKNTVLTIALCLGLLASAQQQEFGKVDFSFGIGFMGTQSQDFSMEEYRTLAPNSEILGKDLSYLKTVNSSYFNTSPLILMNYGFRLKQNDRNETRLRIGVNYSNYNGNNSAFYFEDRSPYDTLRSTQTGQEAYIDSVYTESLFLDFNGERLGLDISYIVAINPNGRWSFYTGIGAEAGIGFNNRLDIYHGSQSSTAPAEQEYYLPYSNDYTANFRESESVKQDNTYYGRLYAPIGLDFRLSKKHKFWSSVHLFSELRPMVELKSNALSEVEFSPGFGWSTIGMRIQF